jgi:hypothetical protein
MATLKSVRTWFSSLGGLCGLVVHMILGELCVFVVNHFVTVTSLDLNLSAVR